MITRVNYFAQELVVTNKELKWVSMSGYKHDYK